MNDNAEVVNYFMIPQFAYLTRLLKESPNFEL